MNCPKCRAPMEQGQLDLKAWGTGFAPQAQLHFDDDLLLKNQYIPVASFFSKGTRREAFRCLTCLTVCFTYDDKTR